MTEEIPADYAALRAEFVAARHALLEPDLADEEWSSIIAELDTISVRLKADPHYQWLQEVKKDERAAENLMLSRQPRGVTLIGIEPNPEDSDDLQFSDMPVLVDLEDPLVLSSMRVG